MAEIIWSNSATNWLAEIKDYIAKDSVYNANKLINEIYQKVQILSDFPNLGYLYKTIEEGEIRILLYGHYRIAYLSGNNEVIVLGIFHDKMILENYL